CIFALLAPERAAARAGAPAIAAARRERPSRLHVRATPGGRRGGLVWLPLCPPSGGRRGAAARQGGRQTRGGGGAGERSRPEDRPTAGQCLRHPWLQRSRDANSLKVWPRTPFSSCTLESLGKNHEQGRERRLHRARGAHPALPAADDPGPPPARRAAACCPLPTPAAALGPGAALAARGSVVVVARR
ncbi:unnamed protein product, partial [Prorocentrum cordatum]